MQQLERNHLLNQGKECLALEAKAIEMTAEKLDEHFTQIIFLIDEVVQKEKKIIFSGLGKSAAISQKLAGTFNSTGVPAYFLDPCQALHGDLGLCTQGDLAIFISNSGQTEELITLLPILKRMELKTVVITAAPDSPLAQHAHAFLLYHFEQEACPLNLAPTASTTAALALGDALAMVYLKVRDFQEEDFAKYHPAGSLGKRLLLRVEDIMRKKVHFACLPETCTVREALLAITKAKCGIIALTHPQTGKLSGVFSDGDFRRYSLQSEDFIKHPIIHYMKRNPQTISTGVLAVDALNTFEQTQVNDLIVVDEENKPVGIIDGQDLPKLHIV